jgi:hypothetical protein
MKEAVTDMHRNMTFYRITANNCIWKWKIANITAQFHTYITQQEREHNAAHTIAVVVNGAALRFCFDALSRMKVSKGNVLGNLWKFMEKSSNTALRRAWYNWSNDMYRERALDWEQNYI